MGAEIPAAFVGAALCFGYFGAASAFGCAIDLTLGARRPAHEAARELWPHLGLVVIVTIGACLNASHSYSAPLFLLAIAIPAALLLAVGGVRSRLVHAVAGLNGLAFAPWLALAVLFTVIPPAINHNDDTTAYLAFIEKMIVDGRTGAEPFSERRLYSFGGQFALTAPFLEFAGLRWLGAFEPALGLLVMGWFFAACPVDRVRKTLVSVLVAAIFAFVSLVGANPIVNSVPVVLPAAILTGGSWALARWLDDRSGRSAWLLVAAAPLAAVSLSFRPTPLVFIGLVTLIMAAYAVGRRQIVPLLVGGLLAILCLAPFAAAMLESSGTLFFPFLGSGVHVPSQDGGYASLDPANILRNSLGDRQLRITLAVMLFAPAVLVVVALLSGRGPRPAIWALAAAIAFVVTAFGVDGVAVHRYTFVFMLAATTLIGVLTPLERYVPGVIARRLGTIGVCIAAIALASLLVPQVRGRVVEAVDKRLANTVLADAGFFRSCRAAQDAVPGGATILVVSQPCASGMAFDRNRIYLHDQVGAAWPSHFDPESGSLQIQLRASGVDYVLWPRALSAEAPASAAVSASEGWMKSMAKYGERFWMLGRSAARGRQPLWSDANVELFAVGDLR